MEELTVHQKMILAEEENMAQWEELAKQKAVNGFNNPSYKSYVLKHNPKRLDYYLGFVEVAGNFKTKKRAYLKGEVFQCVELRSSDAILIIPYDIQIFV